MEIRLSDDVHFNDLNAKKIAAVDFIKRWKPNPNNTAKNPGDDVAWRAMKVRDLIKDNEDEAESVKKLLDCDIQIKDRPKKLPSIDRVYGLLKADNEKKRQRFNRILGTFQDRLDIWSEVNQMDAHIYLATLDQFADEKQAKRFESGLEKYDVFKRIDHTDEVFWKKLDEHTRFHDYQDYYNKRVVNHQTFDFEKDKLPNGARYYRVFTYLGRMTGSHRPLFAVLYINGSKGDIRSDLAKLPKSWIPIYVALPQLKADSRFSMKDMER